MHSFAEADMTWTKPGFSLDEVRAAGEVIRHSERTPLSLEEYARVIGILNNWRSAHNYPLNAIHTHLKNLARAVSNGTPLSVQRTKRSPAIIFKLQNNRGVDLVDMQDIGGCRFILDTIGQVYALRERIVTSKAAHLKERENDYIRVEPNRRGYRSLHLIYRYRDSQADSSWRNIPIEIQIRTKLQHMWATANEIAGLMRGEKFKNGKGDPKWLRMFKLLGSAFAIEEGTTTAPGTPKDLASIKDEVKVLEQELSFCEIVRGFAFGFETALTQPSLKNAHFFLLHFDASKKRVDYVGYPKTWQERAEADYAAMEKQVAEGPEPNKHEVVLVAGSDLKSVKRAYPNYRLDTTGFIGRVTKLS